jgi:ABC-2 type transport system ATP-binding protein
MLEIKNLTKKYGHTLALNNLSIQVNSREICGFLGPNGAGKSTALKIISGFIPSTDGKVFIEGQDLSLNSIEARKKTGYLPEFFVAPYDLRVREYLAYRAGLKGVLKQKVQEEVLRVSELFRIEGFLSHRFDKLSKGYRQRVGLADCLLGDPPLLILDEPFSGLDPLQRNDLREILRKLSDSGKAILFSSHILPEVENIVDNVVILHEGFARAVGDVEKLLCDQSLCHLETDSAPEAVMLFFKSKDFVERAVMVAKNKYELVVPKVARADFLKSLFEEGLSCKSFYPSRRDLEDVFKDFVTKEAE